MVMKMTMMKMMTMVTKMMMLMEHDGAVDDDGDEDAHDGAENDDSDRKHVDKSTFM